MKVCQNMHWKTIYPGKLSYNLKIMCSGTRWEFAQTQSLPRKVWGGTLKALCYWEQGNAMKLWWCRQAGLFTLFCVTPIHVVTKMNTPPVSDHKQLYVFINIIVHMSTLLAIVKVFIFHIHILGGLQPACSAVWGCWLAAASGSVVKQTESPCSHRKLSVCSYNILSPILNASALTLGWSLYRCNNLFCMFCKKCISLHYEAHLHLCYRCGGICSLIFRQTRWLYINPQWVKPPRNAHNSH